MKTPEGHMNALQMLILNATGERVDNEKLWGHIQAIDHLAEDIVSGQEKELQWGHHIYPQIGDLYEVMAKWDGRTG